MGIAIAFETPPVCRLAKSRRCRDEGIRRAAFSQGSYFAGPGSLPVRQKMSKLSQAVTLIAVADVLEGKARRPPTDGTLAEETLTARASAETKHTLTGKIQTIVTKLRTKRRKDITGYSVRWAGSYVIDTTLLDLVIYTHRSHVDSSLLWRRER